MPSDRPALKTSPRGAARPANRGPAAAQSNRAALITAARDLMAHGGIDVPLSRIAQRAGVGQGVLYRHFPTRLDLALAVFEDNFVELEALASSTDRHSFDRLRERLVTLTVESVAFVEVVIQARREHPGYDGHERLGRLLTPALRRAHGEGWVTEQVDIADVGLALRMAYGLLVTAEPDEDTHAAVEQVMAQVWPRRS
ncbi:TetR/AcrR family transcriptional regulator [Actinomycetota bacterium]